MFAIGFVTFGELFFKLFGNLGSNFSHLLFISVFLLIFHLFENIDLIIFLSSLTLNHSFDRVLQSRNKVLNSTFFEILSLNLFLFFFFSLLAFLILFKFFKFNLTSFLLLSLLFKFFLFDKVFKFHFFVQGWNQISFDICKWVHNFFSWILLLDGCFSCKCFFFSL